VTITAPARGEKTFFLGIISLYYAILVDVIGIYLSIYLAPILEWYVQDAVSMRSLILLQYHEHESVRLAVPISPIYGS
jgi:hypothetical protein